MNETKEMIDNFLDDAKVWSFNVKYNNTRENWSIVEGFKSFCKLNSSDNFLLGIKMLLDYYNTDFKYASLYDNIEDLRSELLDFSTRVNKNFSSEESNNSKIKVFGEVE
jgi:hypothetical protein